MEGALKALRLLAAGVADDAAVHRAAAALLTSPTTGTSANAAIQNRALVGDEGGAVVSDEAAPQAGEAAEVQSSPVREAGRVEEVSELYTWGRTKNFQLGFGAVGEEQVVPKLVSLPMGVAVRSVSCGQYHSVVVAVDGAVFCWGFGGTMNRLGIEAGDAACIVQPSRLLEFGPGKHAAVKATAGTSHTLALTAAGRILAWGSNANGQLGLQGVPAAEGSGASRPQVIKGVLKGEVVVDIAAGAAHSLCCIEGGGIFAWGSNERGALGLGSPPAGPTVSSSPSRLPHSREIRSVSTHASGHVSGALTAHGDALIFGCSQAATGDRAAANKASSPTDPRLFVPSRVLRRRGPGASGGSAEGEEWQTQRVSGTAGAAPVLSLVVGTSEAFGIDSQGTLWLWPLHGPRPCTAEELVLAPQAGKGALTSPLQAVAVASRPGSLWLADASASARLWRLKRNGEANAPSGTAWSAERCEHLAQVSAVACGPEHQAAIITFRRPQEGSVSAMPSAVDAESDSDEGSVTGKAPACLFQPASLQELCERKLCRELSPRSFGLLCDIALDFHHHTLLDHAFAFLDMNAPLMFSRLHLPVLSQLPVEVLSAFELVASGQFASASSALEAYPAGLPSPLPGGSGGGDSGGSRAAKQSGQRRKRRSAAWGASPELQAEVASPQGGSLPPGAPPASTGLPPAATEVGSRSPAGPVPTASAVSPQAKAQAGATVEDWVEVRTRRKAGSGSSAGPGSPAAPLASPPVPPARVGGGSGSSPPVGSSGSPAALGRPMPTLADFVRPKLESAALGAEGIAASAALPSNSVTASACAARSPKLGPSAMLMDAVRSAQALGSGKLQAAEKVDDTTDIADTADADGAESAGAAPGKHGKASPCWKPLDAPADGPCLRAILEEEGAGAQPVRGPQAEPVSCSWGRDAMPSEKAKGESVYEIQQQEEVEKSRKRTDDEIQEIEAMFAALEVAELAEAEELAGTRVQEAKTKRPAQAGAKKPAKQPKAPEKCSELPKAQREHQNNKGVKASGRRGPRGGGWYAADGWGSNGWGWADYANWTDTAEASWQRGGGKYHERGIAAAAAAASGQGRKWVRKDAPEAVQEGADG